MLIKTSFITLCSVLLSTVGFAAEPEEIACEYCGMDWNVSSTRMIATIAQDGEAADHHYESLGCVFNALAELGDDAELQEVQVLDYATFGSKTPQLIDAETAVFLFDTEPLEGSMGPFIAAFSTEGAAEKASKKLKGEVMDFEGVRAGITDGSADSAGECNCPHCQAAREGN
jgi:nitrous oxide reductase accessory protein NosL